ncbi:MAG: hypothetical protein J7K22_04400 [Nanoarchaeota archaeon]|nr:hypothetical protein [Nanoarchaeota archaeon]
MKPYQKKFAELLAKTGAIFFGEGLILKDGRPTPYFVNMGGFNNGNLSYQLGLFYANIIKEKFFDKGKNIDIISGPSYKASAIAQATAIALQLEFGITVGFNYDRKEAKTHGEASKVKKLWVGKEFFDGCNWIIVDDVGTTMRTKVEHIKKVRFTEKQLGIKTNLLGVVIGVDREQVDAGEGGEDAILKFMKEYGVPVYAGLGITETVNYLFENEVKGPDGTRVVDEEAMEEFRKYMKTYGVDLQARAAAIEELLN